MPKAILELEMPESCWDCPCIQDRTETYRWCGAVGGDCPNPPYEKRRDDCPLKPVEKGGVNKMNDIFQVDYQPEKKEIRINLPEEVWRNIDTIIMTRLFQEELVVEKQKEGFDDEDCSCTDMDCESCRQYWEKIVSNTHSKKRR